MRRRLLFSRVQRDGSLHVKLDTENKPFTIANVRTGPAAALITGLYGSPGHGGRTVVEKPVASGYPQAGMKPGIAHEH